MSAAGARRLRDAFERADRDGRAAFVTYVLAGHRDLDESVAVAAAALEGGADLLEIGVPFSDPMADGPVIAEAGRAAVGAGAGLGAARQVVRRLRAAGHAQPLLLMSYRNPLQAGGDGLLAELAGDGADGLIVPDLPAGEEPAFERLAAEAGLALSFLVAPNTSPTRVAAVVRASSGFVYVVPRYGVTGSRDGVPAGAVDLVRRVRGAAGGRAPVAAGFGISTPGHVAAFREAVDGVIVGSLLVSAVTDAEPGTAPGRVRDLVARLRAATVRRPAS